MKLYMPASPTGTKNSLWDSATYPIPANLSVYGSSTLRRW